MSIEKTLVQAKGYTITVESWENDGDYSQTKEVTVDTLEKAKALANICELAHRTKNHRNGIGNTCESRDDEKCKDLILEFFQNEENLILLDNISCDDEDDYIDIFNDWAYDLLGCSEFYLYRVCDSYEISYTPEDVYVEKEIILTRGRV